ncbi:hypothetical protein Nocox_36870 [Nonomuraea coxensis DSM 45129]|uniref:Uncharacterized protein n=1 Tax=Nonomuraea coxensis DSM 45129 TaxID=1122611 RepID=A0ABX8UAY3_9ACTN|nr:hypothetical protein [Nonomuraea coxensis]QYC44928.1 hypothetical protein Nocox_36870 [Nonomuraea coxensis DSM 45129]
MSSLRRRRNLDTIVHLDHDEVLFEINVQTGEDPHIEVNYTDRDGQNHRVRLDAEQAGAVWFILTAFDRRAVAEFAALLHEGVHEISNEGDE